MPLPWKSLIAEKITYEARKRTMYGVAILTMTTIRGNYYWIPKESSRNVWDAKDSIPNHSIHNKKAFICHTEPLVHKTLCTDFSGPIMYRNKNRVDKKAYILLFTCRNSEILLQKFFITLIAIDVSCVNSFLMEKIGGVCSMREWLVR